MVACQSPWAPAAGHGILFAAHVVNEAIVDRVPLLRNVCRGETQKSAASVVANSVSDTIKDNSRSSTRRKRWNVNQSASRYRVFNLS